MNRFRFLPLIPLLGVLFTPTTRSLGMNLGSIGQVLSQESDSTNGQENSAENANTPVESFPLQELPPAEIFAPRSEPPSQEEENRWIETRQKVLSDFLGRMNPDFKVPEGLIKRTHFWFDIYAKYGEAHHVIHHVRYPWIVFKIVDTSLILKESKGPAWLRRDKAHKFAKQQTADIRLALKRLAKRKNYASLPPMEKELFEKLSELQGSRKHVIKQAAESVRSQLGQKDFYQRGLINSSRYLPYMEEEFAKMGLPTELTRMPFVESSFNEEAYSKVGASGIWQIMPNTGKAYMRVTETIDERNSPLKATRAAARLLRSYQKALGSWPLAITSYNHGIGNIQKAIKMGRSRDLSLIIERYHDGDFRFASSNFFTCFLAALYAERYHEFIFNEVARRPLQEIERHILSRATRPKTLVKQTGLSQDALLSYNLDLKSAFKNNSLLPKGFELHLPPEVAEKFTAAKPVKTKVSAKAKLGAKETRRKKTRT